MSSREPLQSSYADCPSQGIRVAVGNVDRQDSVERPTTLAWLLLFPAGHQSTAGQL